MKKDITHNRLVRVHRKYQFNENYFEVINTPGKAYWLGFIQADGSIRAEPHKGLFYLTIGLQLKDSYLLEQFLKDIDAKDTPVATTINRIGERKYPGKRIYLCSTKLVKDLIRQGIEPRKSFSGTFAILESKKLLSHYIRGVFDGDGWINMGKNGNGTFGIIAHKEFCEWVLNKIRNSTSISGGGIYKDSKPGKMWQLMIRGNNQLRILNSWIYNEADRYVLRKKRNLFFNVGG